jgi:hypothetical protein
VSFGIVGSSVLDTFAKNSKKSSKDEFTATSSHSMASCKINCAMGLNLKSENLGG